MTCAQNQVLYLITDRHRLASSNSKSEIDGLVDFLALTAASGVDMIQIRERDLSTRDLFDLTHRVVESTRRYQTEILVNDRADIAASIPGVGVHLTTRSLPTKAIRETFGEGFRIGVSTHNLEEVKTAEREGANFVVFGPVFDTESKRQYGNPVGIQTLSEVVSETGIPVLALGGINLSNFYDVIEAGVAGLAGISMFTEASNLANLIARLKGDRE